MKRHYNRKNVNRLINTYNSKAHPPSKAGMKAAEKLRPKKKKLRKAIARINIKCWNDKLAEFALELNANLPASEVWFQALYKQHKDEHDLYNTPLGRFIPDVSNVKFRYVIEVDGSMHNSARVKAKDEKKNAYYKHFGYNVIRVVAYSQQSFDNALNLLQNIRKDYQQLCLVR